MNLSNLIHEVWKDERVKALGIRKWEVRILLHVVADKMAEALLTHKELKIVGLFTLTVKRAKGRRIVNPSTGEHMHSQDYYKVGIRPSKRLRDGLLDMRNETP